MFNWRDKWSNLFHSIFLHRQRYSTLNWAPIIYYHKNFTQSDLARLYRDVDIALISPLRDGMNLVAKEFVACRTKNPGALVLSKFAGAAESMAGAFFINPYYLEEFADTIFQALKCSPEKKQERMTSLKNREFQNDTSSWANGFIDNTQKNFLGKSLGVLNFFGKFYNYFIF